jgi:hypothetical protein
VEYGKEAERAAVLFGGICTLAYADGSFQNVDYATSTSTHFRATTSVWSGAASDIIGDLRSAIHAVRIDSGADPVRVIGYEGMIDDIVRNTVLQNYMKESPNGIRAIENGGYPRLLGLDLIEYGGGYTVSGTWTPYIPAGYVCVMADERVIGTRMLQGEADDLQAIGNPGRFSKTWQTEDPSGIHILVDDVSLPIIEVPSGVCVITAHN